MKASISFPELQSILLEKAEQNISFGFVDGKTIKVTYPLNLGIIKKDISADITIREMVGSDLLVSVDAGFSCVIGRMRFNPLGEKSKFF